MAVKLRNGFQLLELLVALAVALVLVAQIARATLQDTGQARRLGRLLRERIVAQRVLELIRAELQQALEVSVTLPPTGHAGCSFEGRRVRLHLLTAAGRISYSVDGRSSAIWRAQSLVRCGPVYGLDGQLKPGSLEPRVLADALAEAGLILQPGPAGLTIGLSRRFADPSGAPQVVTTTLTSPAPGFRR